MELNATPIEIGKRIYSRRRQLGITQEALADAVETTPQAISNYERGERELKAGVIVKISSALHISTDFLLTGRQNSVALPETLSAAQKEKLLDLFGKCVALLEENSQA